MEDLNERLNRLLSDPETMKKVQSMLSSVTDDSPATETAASPPPDTTAQLSSLLSSAGDNSDAALLKALRPYLHGEREKKLDEAIRLMELSRLLPLLRSQ